MRDGYGSVQTVGTGANSWEGYNVNAHFVLMSNGATRGGLYLDVSDDWIPIYDRTDLAGFYVAIGTSGNQFKTAPAVGELMTALINACENGKDHDHEPVTFHLTRTGHTIALDFFSRNRQPNPSSSLSVLG